MDFKFKAWSHAEDAPPQGLHHDLSVRYGENVAQMAVLTPPLARMYHRVAMDLAMSPRARALAMCAVTYLVAPTDYVPASNARPAETLVDDLYVAWRVLREVLVLHGQSALEKHWRSTSPITRAVALLDTLPVLEKAVPPKALAQIGQYLQVATG